MQAFHALGRSPKYLPDYLNLRLLIIGLEHDEALSQQIDAATKESGFAEQFQMLTGLQMAVLVAMVTDVEALLGEGTLTSYARPLGRPNVTKAAAQKALRVLADKGHVLRAAHGEYLIGDDLFTLWIKERIEQGTLPLP